MTKFQKKEEDNGRKGQWKWHDLEVRVQLRGEDSREEKKKSKSVAKELLDKHKVEGRCMKCASSIH